METLELILAWSLWGVDFASPIVAYLWVKRRTKSFGQAIGTSLTIALGWVFVINGIIGCLVEAPSWLSGRSSFSSVFFRVGGLGLFCSGMGFMFLLLCISLNAVSNRVAIHAGRPNKRGNRNPTRKREPGQPLPGAPGYLPPSLSEAPAERESQCNP